MNSSIIILCLPINIPGYDLPSWRDLAIQLVVQLENLNQLIFQQFYFSCHQSISFLLHKWDFFISIVYYAPHRRDIRSKFLLPLLPERFRGQIWLFPRRCLQENRYYAYAYKDTLSLWNQSDKTARKRTNNSYSIFLCCLFLALQNCAFAFAILIVGK